MSKRTVSLIIGLFLLTVALFWIAFTHAMQPGIQSPLTIVPQTPSPTPIPQATLSFSPSFLTVNKTILASQSADITMTTNVTNIRSVQITLSYEPAAFARMDIMPGTLFSNPSVLQKKIDAKTGTLTLVYVSSTSGTLNTGNSTHVATLNFTPSLDGLDTNGVPFTTIHLSFLPKTAISAEGVATSILNPTSFANTLTIEFATEAAALER